MVKLVVELTLEEEKEYDLRGGDKWLRGVLLKGLRDRVMSSEASSVEEWIEQECRYDAAARVESRAMYKAYCAWCARNGEITVTHKAFTQSVCRYDRRPRVDHGRSNKGSIYIGLSLNVVVESKPDYAID